MEYLMTNLERKIEEEMISLGIVQPADLLDLEDIAKKYNAFFKTHAQRSISGMVLGVDVIRVDNRIPYYNQRQQFFHELGHVVYHIGDQKFMPKSFMEYQEFKARNYALHYAVPTFMLLKLKLPRYRTEAIRKIAHVFQVSYAFAEERFIHFERQVTGHHFYKEIYKPGNYQHSNDSEEKAIDLHDDLPFYEQPAFKRMISELKEKGATDQEIQSLIYQIENSKRKKSVM
ncbi:ImmA/IrrE family metallo-endopeptidase [Halobacillus litoralis]|uniref:IrrE N-terminal-like domain-containing protein n=1 Tax=Halobacillus litoralis TaxID=45668 RepID=A0A410MCF4_9BACI|nr:ImmA/IrrE family metallo-endopeptidase [Halobacillus litoralis]QAS52422.1 hypothetical protein HLI_09330 [Halobacillus litoralis]